MTRGISKAAALVLACSAAAGFAAAQGQAGDILPYDKPDAVEAGRAVYQGHCASCHGSDLQGEPDWQIRDSEGYLPAPPLDGTGHTWHHPDTQLLEVVRAGVAAVAGNGYQSRMAGFSGVLSEQEMREALAYIKSRWPAQIIARHNRINGQGGHAHD